MILRTPATTTTCNINTVAVRSARATIPVRCRNRWRLGITSGPFTFSTTCGSSLLLASLDVDEAPWLNGEGNYRARFRSKANVGALPVRENTHFVACG